MKSASEGPLGAARKVLNQFTEEMSNELKTQGEVLSGEIEKGVNEIMQETASERPLGGAGKALNQFAEEMSTELKKQGEVLGEEIEKGVNEIMQDLQTK
jgi:vacuolar-type H+-ATPase subunit H